MPCHQPKLFYCLLLLLFFIPFTGFGQISKPEWVNDIGSASGSSVPSAVKVDKQNNVYVTGIFKGLTDFDPGPAVYNLSASGGDYDIYVAKYTTAGKLIWAVAMGGNGTDQVNSMTIDNNGNPIISGQYNSSNLDADPGAGVFNLKSNGSSDAFIIKLTTNGAFAWAKSIGGSFTDYGGKVVADSKGNVVQVVQFQGSVVAGGKTYTSLSGTFNGLIVKYDANGNQVWAINHVDTGDNEPHSCAIDAADNVIVSGVFSGTVNFNPLGTSSTLSGNGESTYIAKYTSAGTLTWVKSISGQVVSNNTNLCVNSKSEIYIDGPFAGQLVFNGTKSLIPQGGRDIFIAKYSAAGAFLAVDDVGGAGARVYNYGIVASNQDEIYLSGYFDGTVDFNPASGVANVSYHGIQDLFLAKYDSDLNYKWAFSAGNALCSNTLGRNVEIDNNNNVLLVGAFCSTVNFDATNCTSLSLTAQSSDRDSFVAKYVQATGTDNLKITGFSVPGQSTAAVIDQSKLLITVTVPKGTNITALKPVIALSSGTTVSPASGAAQNFTSPVSYKLSGNCANLNYTVQVVFAVPVTGITICSAAAAVLTGDVTSPAPDTYGWQVKNSSGAWVTADGVPVNKDYITSPLTNTSATSIVYSLRRQTTTKGVIAYDSYYDVTVKPIANVTSNTITAPVVATFCGTGDAAVIIGSTPAGGDGTFNYQWQSSTDNATFTNITGATAKNYDPLVIKANTFYRRVVSSGACTTPLISNVVTLTIVNAPVAPSSTATAVTICQGSAATLTIASPQPGIVYNWYNSPARTTLLATGTSFTTPILNAGTVYYAESSNGTCSSLLATAITVTVVPLPNAPSVASTVVCSGSAATLSISNAQAGVTYNWYSSSTDATVLHTGINYSIPNVTADVTYFIEAINAGGCAASARASAKITVVALPVVTAQSTSVCPGNSVTLSAASTGASSIKWYDAATGGKLLATGSTFVTPVLNSAVNYYVEASTAGGCVNAARLRVQVQMIQPLNAPVVNVGDVTGSSVSFKWDAVPGAQGYLVSIDNGKTYTTPSSGSSGLSHVVDGLKVNDQVTILVEAVGATPCELSKPATITATAMFNNNVIYVANNFTPNGDGNNDIVYVHGESIKSMAFYVYDQWGELLFTTTDIRKGWDGYYKGTREPVGVYVYYVKATMNDGAQLNKKGTITLLR